MDSLNYKHQCILIVGSNKLAISVCVCLCKAGHDITLLNEEPVITLKHIKWHLQDLKEVEGETVDVGKIEIITSLLDGKKYDLVIAITEEDLDKKIALIELLEHNIDPSVSIAINTESIAISTLQQRAKHPERIIGANWVEPAHTTYFLEIVTNETTNRQLVESFFNLAKEHWNKDPYIIKSDKGIRSRLMCALIREAFYLIENNYVTVEDIDRACRNDAGYYLAFSGNFRYMDLMGTYMYGIVMQDLNPELSKDTHIPKFVEDLINDGGKGMANGKGFYNYEPGEAHLWEETFRKFSYKIQHIIGKYSHIHNREETEVMLNP
jgi:3-hydroxybutyryl-CoA dehydrogenase